MKKLTKKLWSHASDTKRERQYVTDIQKSNPKSVHTYMELVREVATISFNNPELNIFFRGQGKLRSKLRVASRHLTNDSIHS